MGESGREETPAMNALEPRARANREWQAQCQPKAGASCEQPREPEPLSTATRNPPLSPTLSPLRGARESHPTLNPDLDRDPDPDLDRRVRS